MDQQTGQGQQTGLEKDGAADIARAFVTARRAAQGLCAYPGTIPTTLQQGYAVQDAAIAIAGKAVAGWKVGKIPAPLDAQHGINRLAGPIFAGTVFEADDSPIAMPIFADGFGAAEAEYLLRVGTAPDATRTEWTLADAAAHIDAVHVGIEIASSPFTGINSGGPTVTVSDYGNNNGLVIGDAVPDWQSENFIDWPVALTIDGVEAGAATARAMLDGPFGAAAFLFGHLAQRGIAMTPGQWISSGAVTGVHDVEPGATVAALFGPGPDVQVRCGIVAAQAG